MTCNHVQNHPNSDDTKHPLSDDFYKHVRNYPDLDYIKHPLSDDLQNHPNLDDFIIQFSVLHYRRKTGIYHPIWMIFHNTDETSTICRFVWIMNHPFLESELFHVKNMHVVIEHQTQMNQLISIN